MLQLSDGAATRTNRHAHPIKLTALIHTFVSVREGAAVPTQLQGLEQHSFVARGYRSVKRRVRAAQHSPAVHAPTGQRGK